MYNAVKKVLLKNFQFAKRYGHLKYYEWIMIFLNFLVFFFWPYLALQGSGCAFKTVLVATFHLTPISTKSGNKKFLVWKSKYLQYSKFKKFCQIKIVNMQIDRNGTQKHYSAAAVLLGPYRSPPFIWHQFQRNWRQQIFFFKK